jgi:threonine-phosphate decarboxylase
VAITVPAFGEYERAARNARAEVLYHQMRHEDGFSLDGPRLAATAAKCHLTFFCNPASPTGHLYGRRELLGVLEACRGSGGTLVLDESFMGFCSREEAARATLLPEVGEGGLVVISTLTKIYALAGLRGPGWLAGPRGLVSALEEAASPWRVNVAAQAAAMAALEDGAYLEMTRAAVRAWREELADGLRATGMFEVFPSHADFLLLRVSRGGLEAGELADALGIRGVLVRDCRDFRGLEKGFLRVAVRRPEENRRLLEALAEAVADKRA